MSTNYYLHLKPPCHCCGHQEPPLHIGKSSGGWCFALHVFREEELPEGVAPIRSLEDWEKLWTSRSALIKDEYRVAVHWEEMRKIISQRSWRNTGGDSLGRPKTLINDRDTAWYRRNYAEPGPNGLIRCRADAHPSCVGHGEGTWDLLEGYFS